MKKLLLACTLIVISAFGLNAQIIKSGNITANETWTSNNIYLLNGWVYVKAGVTVTIQPGTVIKGDFATKGALIIERDAKLIADGTVNQPIVFTSQKSPGLRTYGDWGGVILCGRASTNWAAQAGPPATTQGEGVVEGGVGSIYGGGLTPNDDDSSGVMRYVRIEFPGVAFQPNSEINGLTLCGVGRKTVIDYVQVSYSGDDSFEWFGGTVNCKHLIAYRGWDDDFDTDYGFQGKVQFAVSMRDPAIADQSGSNGFESDNNAGGTPLSPRTRPVFSNVSVFGPLCFNSTFNSLYRRGAHLRRDTECSMFNSVFAGWPTGLLIESSSTQANATGDSLRIRNTVFAQMTDTLAATSVANPNNTNGSFNIGNPSASTGWFYTAGFNNSNPATVASLMINNLNLATPDLTLAAGSPLLTGAAFTESYVNNSWFTNVSYRGAFDGTNDWTDCWAMWDCQNEPYIQATNTAFTVTATAGGPTTFCVGGSVTLDAGSYPGATFAWSNGGTTQTINVTTAGTYSCTVTKSNGCVATSNAITVTVNSLPTVSASAGSPSICAGSSTSLTGSGASTYTWMPGSLSGSPVSVTPSGTTTYTVTGTNSNGCTNTGTVAVTVNSLPSVTASAGTTTICMGGSTTLTGGNATSYVWMPGSLSGTTVTVSPTANTTYTVTGTNSNGCTNTATVTVNVSPSFTLTTASQTNVTCNGGNNGSASINASGGTGALSYAWSPSGGNASVATGLASGTYTCTVTDVVGCTGTRTVTITQPSAITSSVSSQTNLLCNGASTGAATISASGGTGSLSYSWSPSGGTAATATGLTAQNYTVTITDANSCTRTQTLSITQPAAITSNVSAQTNITCNGGNNGAATISASGGTGTLAYNWAPMGGNAASATGLTAQTYTVTITDANSCVRTQTLTITQPSAINSSVSSQTNVLCNGGTTGSATIAASGGTGTLTYNWVPSGGTAATATGLGAGLYAVTITDGNGCTRSQVVNITQPTAITGSVVTSANATCGSNNGSATISASGGTGSLSYNWAPSGGTGTTASGLAAGSYTVTVTDANSCTSSVNVSISNQGAATVTTNTFTNVSCNGGSNGTASVNATGGTGTLTYNWTPGNPAGDGTNSVTGLTAGTWTCTVTDANNCITVQTVVITQPPVINAFILNQTNVSCNGGNNGSATVNAIGGTGTYTYSWSPSGGSLATANGLTAGSYTCTLTDGNGCTATRSLTITQPGAISTSVTTVSNATCFGSTDGSASISASGGTGTLNYSWAPSGGINSSASGLTAGNYTVTVTDVNACIATQSLTITSPAQVSVTANATADSVCAGTMVTLTGSGSPATYTWTNGVTNGVAFSATATTTYTVTGTDSLGCSNMDVITITVNALPVVNANTSAANVCAGTMITLSGSGTATSYVWDNSVTNAVAFAASSSMMYHVTGTDANGCSAMDSISVNVNPLPTVNANATATTVCAGTSITLTGSGSATSYTWDNSVSNGVAFTANNSTMYIVTGTDANGCSSMDSVMVTVNALPNVTFSIAPVTMCQADGSLNLSGSPSGGTFSGSTGVSGSTFSPAGLGGPQTVVYTYTDANGCVGSASDVVIVDSCVGIVEIGNPLANVLVYPNPTYGDFTLDLGYTPEQPVVVEVYNSIGQTINVFTITSDKVQINLNEVESGIYSIRIIDGTAVSVVRVIRQ
jgi:hypothetical protein